ncbi:hypothetical protein IscW_ISCW021181 [Ixodes scapularis]|uniref:Uncharacterized protein n=1 Tax=Ixodes scapularis TaxID=6945 RepID=B7Q6F9_IXOSC|nr:hypothetical protein IscW_ISCW021181 [Ixodes scapularis]|eukprot:XP_002402951.1 hypothetical protein IscW_ISCW021181 [Ixodes scapularis]
MREEEKPRQLTCVRKAEMLERVVLANRQTTDDFLGRLQRLTQASQMTKHNNWTMPSNPLPDFSTLPDNTQVKKHAPAELPWTPKEQRPTAVCATA